MALKSELMASSLPAAAASKIGFDAPNLTVTAAGGSQTTATALVSNCSVITGGSGAGVIINERHAMTAIANQTGGNVTVYPPVGGTINGGTLNAGFTVGTGKSALFFSAGTTWIANLSA